MIKKKLGRLIALFILIIMLLVSALHHGLLSVPINYSRLAITFFGTYLVVAYLLQWSIYMGPVRYEVDDHNFLRIFALVIGLGVFLLGLFGQWN